MSFWLVWGIAVIVTATVVYFFLLGLADGSVSSFNVALWGLLLWGVIGVTGGSLWLRKRNRVGLAILLASLLALPGVAAVIFLLAVLLSDPKWN